jgi:hypothetical protein
VVGIGCTTAMEESPMDLVSGWVPLYMCTRCIIIYLLDGKLYFNDKHVFIYYLCDVSNI